MYNERDSVTSRHNITQDKHNHNFPTNFLPHYFGLVAY